jgi:hypothetical protein
LLFVSLSLYLVAAQLVHAQTGRSSAANSLTDIRVAPTAVPSATAKPLGEVAYNSCVAPAYEALSGGIPYTGLCTREYVAGKYECRHRARDFCEAIAGNRSNQVMGAECRVVVMSLDKSAPDFQKKLSACLLKECVEPAFVPPLGSGIKVKQDECNRRVRECSHALVSGHAVNIFRSGGQKNTLGGVAVAHSFAFSLVEPAQPDGSSAVLCTWSQTNPEPVIPPHCKEPLLRDYFSKQLECHLTYKTDVFGLEEFKGIVADQDRMFGYSTPKP